MLAHDTPPSVAVSSVIPVQHELPRILAEADAAPLPVPPPVCNTGVETSNAGVDWLEMTHPDPTGRVWCDILGIPESEWTDGLRGMHGYRSGRQAGHVCVWYDGNEGMGSHVSVAGQGCRALETRWVSAQPSAATVTWAAFLARCVDEYGCKVTRLDLFRDDREGVLDVAECRRKLGGGEVTSRTKRVRCVQEFEIGGGVEGDTVYVGKRVSDTMLRIYDKAQQSCPKGVDRVKWLREYGPHVRVEVVIRRERAHKVVCALVKTGFGGGIIAGLINKHVEFKESDARGHNGNRVPIWGAWLKVLGTPEKLVLATHVVERGLSEIERWLDRQCGPMIATLTAFYKGDMGWLRGMNARSWPRLTDKHTRLLEDADGGFARSVGLVGAV